MVKCESARARGWRRSGTYPGEQTGPRVVRVDGGGGGATPGDDGGGAEVAWDRVYTIKACLAAPGHRFPHGHVSGHSRHARAKEDRAKLRSVGGKEDRGRCRVHGNASDIQGGDWCRPGAGVGPRHPRAWCWWVLEGSLLGSPSFTDSIRCSK